MEGRDRGVYGKHKDQDAHRRENGCQSPRNASFRVIPSFRRHPDDIKPRQPNRMIEKALHRVLRGA